MSKFKKKLIQTLRYLFNKHKIKEYQTIDGFLTRGEALGLYTCSKSLNSGATVVEIGSWKGKSTYCIAKGLTSGRIFAIDPFDASGEPASAETYSKKKGADDLYNQFKKNMTKLNVMSKIHPLKGYSNEFINQVKDIDFLFIDGDHSIKGCDFDFINYSPLVKVGGLIAFHDYYPEQKDLGPTWVIENRILNSKNYQSYDRYDSLFIAKKISM